MRSKKGEGELGASSRDGPTAPEVCCERASGNSDPGAVGPGNKRVRCPMSALIAPASEI